MELDSFLELGIESLVPRVANSAVVMENRPPQLEPAESCLYAAVERSTVRHCQAFALKTPQ